MKTVVCFGEILWDILPHGNYLGGAPYNVAYHLAHLGCHARLVSAVGNDLLGGAALASAEGLGIETKEVSRLSSLPTGSVSVSVDAEGQPSYHIAESVAWDHITATPAPDARPPDAVVYGTLALRSLINRRTLRAWTALEQPLKVCDLNLRAPYDNFDDYGELIGSADLLKLNQDEARRLARRSPNATTPAQQAAAIANDYGCSIVCITLGAKGALLWTKGRIYEAASPDVPIRDTIGAGDAFTAALLAGRLQSGRDPDWQQLLSHACTLGAFVASQDGAQPPYELADVPELAAIFPTGETTLSRVL